MEEEGNDHNGEEEEDQHAAAHVVEVYRSTLRIHSRCIFDVGCRRCAALLIRSGNTLIFLILVARREGQLRIVEYGGGEDLVGEKLRSEVNGGKDHCFNRRGFKVNALVSSKGISACMKEGTSRM